MPTSGPVVKDRVPDFSCYRGEGRPVEEKVAASRSISGHCSPLFSTPNTRRIAVLYHSSQRIVERADLPRLALSTFFACVESYGAQFPDHTRCNSLTNEVVSNGFGK